MEKGVMDREVITKGDVDKELHIMTNRGKPFAKKCEV